MNKESETVMLNIKQKLVVRFVDSHVSSSGAHNSSESVGGNQPLFGDVSPNFKGNNGYGFDEHEHYLRSNDTYQSTPEYIAPMPKSLDLVNDKVICIMAGEGRSKLDQIANKWHMTVLGDAFFDDGESMTPEHIDEVTAVYYENSIPNKSSAFIKAVQQELPYAFISTEMEYSMDLGDDVSRFGNVAYNFDEDVPVLDFDGLNGDGLEI